MLTELTHVAEHHEGLGWHCKRCGSYHQDEAELTTCTHDRNQSCRYCTRPVGNLSTGGPDICPRCDVGPVPFKALSKPYDFWAEHDRLKVDFALSKQPEATFSTRRGVTVDRDWLRSLAVAMGVEGFPLAPPAPEDVHWLRRRCIVVHTGRNTFGVIPDDGMEQKRGGIDHVQVKWLVEDFVEWLPLDVLRPATSAEIVAEYRRP